MLSFIDCSVLSFCVGFNVLYTRASFSRTSSNNLRILRKLQLFEFEPCQQSKGEEEIGMSSMGDRYNLYSRGGSSDWTASMRNEEFQEDDVWSVFRESKYSNSSIAGGSSREVSTASTITHRGIPIAAKMIPRTNKNPATHEPKPQMLQQSAPVNIPDWSKIYGKKHSKKKYLWLDHEDDEEEDDVGGEFWGESWGDSDDGDDDNMMPPHEWIAKKLARTQISSFSVCEGAGRTLKGRDLKRVRNAILSKTGFLED